MVEKSAPRRTASSRPWRNSGRAASGSFPRSPWRQIREILRYSWGLAPRSRGESLAPAGGRPSPLPARRVPSEPGTVDEVESPPLDSRLTFPRLRSPAAGGGDRQAPPAQARDMGSSLQVAGSRLPEVAQHSTPSRFYDRSSVTLPPRTVGTAKGPSLATRASLNESAYSLVWTSSWKVMIPSLWYCGGYWGWSCPARNRRSRLFIILTSFGSPWVLSEVRAGNVLARPPACLSQPTPRRFSDRGSCDDHAARCISI